jgi:hypothetical protein
MMAAFSWYRECDGNEVALIDVFDNAIKNVNTDYIYWGVLVKNYFGKNIEIKITDIEKDKEYHKKLLEKEIK